MDGFARMWRKNNTLAYEGQYILAVRNGQGTFYDEKGGKYTGGWRQDKYHGHGTWSVNGKVEYSGYWDMGKRVKEPPAIPVPIPTPTGAAP